jgi:hypothetical protein
MKTFEITKDDILGVAKRINQTLTEKELNWALLCYEDAQRQDPSGTWDLVVEDLIYQIPRIHDNNDFKNPKFGEDASTDDTWFDNEDLPPINHFHSDGDGEDDVNLNIGEQIV